MTDHVVPIGITLSGIDGPHNVTVAPDQKSYYVSVAHGTPYGSLWRLSLPGDTLMMRDGALYVNTFNTGRLFRIPVNADGTAGALVPIETSLPLTRPDGLRTE